jgi:type I restriction enzyme S subunit
MESTARTIFKSWFVDFDPVRAKAEGREPEGMDATTASLFPSGFQESELGRIPKGWSISAIGQKVYVIDCLHSKKPERLDRGKPFLQLSNIQDNGIVDMSDTYNISDEDYEKWISRIEASPGDCVITNVGRVGAVAQMPTDVRAALGRNMTGLRCKEDFPFATFLIELMMSGAMREEISFKTDSGTILDSLNVRSIPRLRFACPSSLLLKHFEDSCRPLRAKMEICCKQTRILADLRDTLLPRLISGKLRVPEAEAMLTAV